MGLFTAREAADYLHVSRFTLSRMEKEGLLEPFRTPGGHRRYSREMLDHYLEASRPLRANHEKRILLVGAGDDLLPALARAFPACRFTRAQDELEVGINLAAFKPDLVLVNNTASGVDPQELCRKLSEQSPDVKVLPFHGAHPDKREATRPGPNAHFLDGLSATISAAFDLERRRETG